MVTAKWHEIIKKSLSGLLALIMVFSMLPSLPITHVHAEEESQALPAAEESVTLEPLHQTISVTHGQLLPDPVEIVENEIYGYVVDYELKKGHVLSISNTDYVFSVRKLVNGNYSTMLKQATVDSFTATEDMTVGMLIRKPDKSALTAEELASVVLYDTQYGMQDVEGYAQRFYVDAETIDGGTASTRCNIFLPAGYSEDGEPTKLIVMTNGHSAYLKDNVWNGNTADNVGVIRNYLNAGYAVWVVNNTADSTSRTTDIGCPQLVSSYLKAYEYIQQHFNVEKKFSIHSRSFGTFAAVRIMLEVPELVNCAVMTGPRVSIKLAWTANKAFVAKRFGFEDKTGATYEADKMVGHDPYTDVNSESYSLPPTFWMMCQGDATAEPQNYIDKLIAHGNDVTYKTYTDTDHTGICTLNQEHMFSDALVFLEESQIKELSLRYDDHLDMTGKTVEIIDAGTPTSYKVGYGVAEGTLDDAVLTLDGDTLIATGIGTAQVRIDGQLYEITVTAAPISLLLIIGQSNAEGMEGVASQSVICPDGQVYSTYAKANGLTGDAGLTVENAGNYVPSALTGIYSAINVNGTDTKLCGYPVNSLTEEGDGKYGMDSGLAYEWGKQTGEKVWVVNAAHGASSITSWQKDKNNFNEAVALFGACQKVLQAEIAAGHYTFSHMGYYWNQGCADETRTAEWYVGQYLAMHENLKIDLACDMDGDAATPDNVLEFGNILLVQAGHSTAAGYRKGTYEDPSDSFFMTYKELEMRGPRVAQIWMANNPELTDIHIVSTLAQDWVTMPDGTDGVAKYFHAAYENGTVDYTTQVKQSASWYTPATPAAVKDSIHYNQIGYNEIGREAARNTLYILGIAEKPEVETTVTFLDWTGYRTADTLKSTAVGASNTLVVPFVFPCYESKTVSYAVNDGLKYSYYDLLDTGVDGGTLTASVGTQVVCVVGREYCSYRFELRNDEMVSVCDDTFRENLLTRNSASTKVYSLADPVILKHNKPWVVEFNSVESTRFMALASTKGATEGMFYFFKSKSGSGVLSIGEYKDGLYQNYGLKQTEIGIDWTKPHVYRFQNVINDDGTNTVHIYIDDDWVGTATNLIINDTLQSTDNMYLSGKDLVFSSIGCGGFALDSNQMTYLEVWENGKPSHIPGDITGDGDVNNKDLTRLFKYLTGYDVEVVEAALDVNGDGVVNNKDQTRLFRYLSGYGVEIH